MLLSKTRYIQYFLKRKIYPGFKVGKNDLVIDIGSGDKPFWRGDVFFDNLSLSNNQRINRTETVHSLGTFVNGDIIKTPFKDKAFDFSFCSHVLEHVKRPDLAIKEIMRISKRGYIESPNGLVESIYPFQSHLWFVYFYKKKLIFVSKSKKMHEILSNNGVSYAYIIPSIRDPFIRLYWNQNIEYEIYNEVKKGQEFNVETQKPDTDGDKENNYLYFVKFMRTVFRRNKNVNVSSLLK